MTCEVVFESHQTTSELTTSERCGATWVSNSVWPRHNGKSVSDSKLQCLIPNHEFFIYRLSTPPLDFHYIETFRLRASNRQHTTANNPLQYLSTKTLSWLPRKLHEPNSKNGSSPQLPRSRFNPPWITTTLEWPSSDNTNIAIQRSSRFWLSKGNHLLGSEAYAGSCPTSSLGIMRQSAKASTGRFPMDSGLQYRTTESSANSNLQHSSRIIMGSFSLTSLSMEGVSNFHSVIMVTPWVVAGSRKRSSTDSFLGPYSNILKMPSGLIRRNLARELRLGSEFSCRGASLAMPG